MKSIRCRLDCATWCEYFKSGECTSQEKCEYQTEHMSVKFSEAIFMPTKEAWEKMQAENSRLTAENKAYADNILTAIKILQNSDGFKAQTAINQAIGVLLGSKNNKWKREID